MANIAKQSLQDKDIRNLKPSDKRYKKAVGNPKELYILYILVVKKLLVLKLMTNTQNLKNLEKEFIV